jgi:hypothetical protein
MGTAHLSSLSITSFQRFAIIPHAPGHPLLPRLMAQRLVPQRAGAGGADARGPGVGARARAFSFGDQFRHLASIHLWQPLLQRNRLSRGERRGGGKRRRTGFACRFYSALLSFSAFLRFQNSFPGGFLSFLRFLNAFPGGFLGFLSPSLVLLSVQGGCHAHDPAGGIPQ